MRRRLKFALIVGIGLLVVAVAVLWALPEILRRVALDQIAKRTGRAATIGDVDLNLFTGHLAIKQFRLTDRRGPRALRRVRAVRGPAGADGPAALACRGA